MPGKLRDEREPKDPVRKGRAELVKAATLDDWQARPGGKLEKQGRGGTRLVVAKAPDYILDGDGEIIGVDAWVQLFDERGRELPIDPHRRIINPPTVPRSGVRIADTGQMDPRRKQPITGRQVTADPVAAFWEAVWDSVEETPNAKGWRTRGTVTTIYSGTNDGDIYSVAGTYTTARAGNELDPLAGGDTISIMQFQNAGTLYEIQEGFVSFDTSAIADADMVSAVTLDMYLDAAILSTNFTVEARYRSWSPTLTTADWVAGASLGTHPLMASIATASIGASGSYKTFTSEAAFLTVTGIKTGVVDLLLCSSRHRLGNSPGSSGTTQETTRFFASDQSGTSQDPKLTITHAGLGSAPFFTSQPNRIWRLG